MPYKFSFLLVYFSLHNVKIRANIKQAYIPAQQVYIPPQFMEHFYINISIGVGWGCIPVPLL